MSKKKTNQPAKSKIDKKPKPLADTTEQESLKDDEVAASIKPVTPKIGEGSGNLRRRQEWFQKRSGGK